MANVENCAVVDHHDIGSILFGSDRDFLVRNNGDQVKFDSLKGKNIGLYFLTSWCGASQQFTPYLVEVYNQIFSKGDFEIIFVSVAQEDEETFIDCFSKMPWLAIPFFDSETRDYLDSLFERPDLPSLLILDGSTGKVICQDGFQIIREYGVKGYPFTLERIKELKEKAKREQTLKSILVSGSRDFVISSDGRKVLVSELEGKLVGLYFSLSSHEPGRSFSLILVEVYEKLKAEGKSFEIVSMPLDHDEESYNLALGKLPWLSLPFGGKSCERLQRYFELSYRPSLVIIGNDGKTLHANAVETIEENGALAYPFTPERFAELEEIEKAAQTLESVLVSGDLDFVITNDGAKIMVSDLVGKTILLFFAAEWCTPCHAFLQKLTKAYNKIKKANNSSFEVIFISCDRDVYYFEDLFLTMPWLALPFGDARTTSLSKKFKVSYIPMVIAIGPNGKTVSTSAGEHILIHGADAYPFTDERLKEIELQQEEMARGWPKKLKHALHEVHELVLSRRKFYRCDGCEEEGYVWSFFCKECDFDLHPKCAE